MAECKHENIKEHGKGRKGNLYATIYMQCQDCGRVGWFHIDYFPEGYQKKITWSENK